MDIHSLLQTPELQPLLSILKGVYHGMLYGGKLRFIHSLATALLYHRSSDSVSSVLLKVLRDTRTHAFTLGKYVGLYKTFLLVFRSLHSSASSPTKSATASRVPSADSFWAGVLAGVLVYGRDKHPIPKQIVMYLISRVALALANLALNSLYPISRTSSSLPTSLPTTTTATTTKIVAKRTALSNMSWAITSGLTWGMVMYIFEFDRSTLQSSLRRSMEYLYEDSNWTGEEIGKDWLNELLGWS